MPSVMKIKTVFTGEDRLSRKIGGMQRKMGRFVKRTEVGLKRVTRITDKVASGIFNIGKTAAKVAVVGIGVLTASVIGLIREFSKIEDAQAAFTPLLGGVERANELVQKLNKTAASTPFQFETLAGSAKQLLPVMEGDIQRTIKTIRMLGDTAGGNAQKLESITRGFTKASLKGKVDLESLNMIAEAGVPIFQELAKTIGMEPGKKFFKTISAGKVSVDDLTKSFENMTKEGGIFFKGMEIASKTTSGIFSTLKDNISLTAAVVGSALAPAAKDIMSMMIDIAANVREWIKGNEELIKVAVAEYANKIKDGISGIIEQIKMFGQGRGTLAKVWNVLKKIGTVVGWVVDNWKGLSIAVGIILGISAAVKTLTAVLTVMNLVMAANPMVLIIMGIIVAVGALTAVIVSNWDKIKPVLEAIGMFFYNIGKAIWDGVVYVARSAAEVVMETWISVKGFFINLWNNLKSIFNEGANWILFGPIGWMIKAVQLVIDNWGKVKTFFKSLWDGIIGIFEWGWSKIKPILDKMPSVMLLKKIGGGISDLFTGKEELPGITQGQRTTQPETSMSTVRDSFSPQMVSPSDRDSFSPQMVSPSERTARVFEERNMTTTNRSEVTIKDESGRAVVTQGELGAGLTLEPTGTF